MSRDTELAAEFGTPLYVYDLDRVTAARTDLGAALPETFEVFYSFKANPHPVVAAALRDTCRAEISSTGELDAAARAGFDLARALYTGPGKTAGEVSAAIDAGVRTFSVESLVDQRRVGAVATAFGVTADCLVRINNAAAGAATSIRMTGRPSQFGIDSERLPELMDEMCAVPGTRIVGAHLFSLSNANDEQSLIGELCGSVRLAAAMHRHHGLPLRMLDLGGGFAAPYLTPGERPVYRGLRAALTEALDAELPHWRDIEITVESGRHLVGDCGELVSAVVDVKESRGRRFVVLDAGINTLGGMAGLGRLLPLSLSLGGADTTGAATLVGPLCTPGDVLGREVKVPDLAPGDVVTVPNAGAYGLTASLVLFLGRPAPAEIVVQGGEVVSATRLESVRSELTA